MSEQAQRLTEEQLDEMEEALTIPQDVAVALLSEVRQHRAKEREIRHDKHCHLMHEHAHPKGCPFTKCPGCSCG